MHGMPPEHFSTTPEAFLSHLNPPSPASMIAHFFNWSIRSSLWMKLGTSVLEMNFPPGGAVLPEASEEGAAAENDILER